MYGTGPPQPLLDMSSEIAAENSYQAELLASLRVSYYKHLLLYHFLIKDMPRGLLVKIKYYTSGYEFGVG